MEITALLKALLKVQQELKPVSKNQEADTGRFKYAYADLAQVLEMALPVLSKHGLVLIQHLETDPQDHELKLHTIIAHAETGQNIISKAPLLTKELTSQGLGSAITYMRRYSLMAMIGMVASDEDDDGQTATKPIQTLQKSNTPLPQKQIPNLAPKASKPLIQPSNPEIKAKLEQTPQIQSQTGPSRGPTEKQIKRFFAIAMSRGWSEKAATEYIESLFKKQIHQLSREEYDEACNWVQNNSPNHEDVKQFKKELDRPLFDPNEPWPTDDDIPF